MNRQNFKNKFYLILIGTIVFAFLILAREKIYQYTDSRLDIYLDKNMELKKLLPYRNYAERYPINYMEAMDNPRKYIGKIIRWKLTILENEKLAWYEGDLQKPLILITNKKRPLNIQDNPLWEVVGIIIGTDRWNRIIVGEIGN